MLGYITVRGYIPSRPNERPKVVGVEFRVDVRYNMQPEADCHGNKLAALSLNPTSMAGINKRFGECVGREGHPAGSVPYLLRHWWPMTYPIVDTVGGLSLILYILYVLKWMERGVRVKPT